MGEIRTVTEKSVYGRYPEKIPLELDKDLSSAAAKHVVKMEDANVKLTRFCATVDVTIVYHAKINNLTLKINQFKKAFL